MRFGCFFFSGFFWGVLLVLLGILIIVRILFNINIPVFRIFFALLLVYLGIRLLVGGWGCGHGRNAVCYHAPENAAAGPSDRYDIVFGKAVIDLSNIPLQNEMVSREVKVVFGSGTIKINPGQPVKVVASSAFGSVHMPDGNIITFGNYVYKSPGYKENAPYVLIRASVAFGELSISSSL